MTALKGSVPEIRTVISGRQFASNPQVLALSFGEGLLFWTKEFLFLKEVKKRKRIHLPS